MAEPKREADGFYHPASVAEITELIRTANKKGLQLRVRGSMHSVPQAIFTDGFSEKDPGRNINIKLDRFCGVKFSRDDKLARVLAGTHLGVDPADPVPPDPEAKWKQSLLAQLDAKHQALQDLGGITHQTVSGFLSTGSSGGSLKRSLHDQVRRIRLVDGNGNLRDLERGTDEFYAAGVSMGLLGVIVDVEFDMNCPRFTISGQEAITTEQDCEIDLFGPGGGGRPSLEAFLRDKEYTRLMWWPQKKVNKVAVWRAEKNDYVPLPLQPYQEMGASPVNWSALPLADFLLLIGKISWAIGDNLKALQPHVDSYIAGLPEELQELAQMLYEGLKDKDVNTLQEAMNEAVGDVLQIIINAYFLFLGSRNAGGLAEKMFAEIFDDETQFENKWSPLIMNYLFLVADKDKPAPAAGQPQLFWDNSYDGLPMDNKISDSLMPTVFTELWIPIDRTQAVMNALKTFYEGGGYERTGTYACEIYGTKKSPFWMSPAYGQDVVRIDIFWFGRNAEPPDQRFYPQFWNLLKDFNFRPHWGKYLPPGDGPQGAAYLRKNYPKWDDFMKLRARYDPRQIFVTDYWRSHLGIPRP